MPKEPDQSKMKQRQTPTQRPSSPPHPLSTQRGGNKAPKCVVKKDPRRTKTRTNKRTPGRQKRYQAAEKRWWRRDSPCPDQPPQNPSPLPDPIPAPVEKLPNPVDPNLSPVCLEEKELLITDVDVQDFCIIPDVAEKDICLIQYHIPVAKCSTREIRDSLYHTTSKGDSEFIPDSKEVLDFNQKVDLEILKCQEALQVLEEKVKRLSGEPNVEKAIQKFQQSQPEIPYQPDNT